MIPQIIMIVLFAMSFTLNLVNHGEDKDDKYNVWYTIIFIAIECTILYCGGFWDGM
jgi:hypothetical protein